MACGVACRLWSSGMTFQSGDFPAEEAWDWRSVTLAARAYPASRITLWSPWVLDVHHLTRDEVNERYPLIDIVDVRVIARYIVELTFDNGERRVIDLEGDLWGPMFEPMRTDYAYFCSVAVDPELGTIAWPNGADLAPERLYADSRAMLPE